MQRAIRPLVAAFIMGVLVTSLAAAQQEEAEPSRSPAVEAEEAPPSAPVGIDLLEQRNTLLEAHNKALMQVLYWSLAFAAVFLLTFLGLVGYLTVRRYDQDKESLRSLIESGLSASEAHLDGKLAEWSRSFEVRIADEQKELRASLSKLAGQAAEESVRAISWRLESVTRDIASVEGALLRREAERWEEKGIAANALRTWFEYAQHMHRVPGKEWRVSQALEKLDSLLAEGARFDVISIPDVTRFLKSLPEDLEPFVVRIRTRLTDGAS